MPKKALNFTAVFMSSILFGAGLELSQMTNPEKVQGFLNITGQWDPSLIFVMVGAIAINTILYFFTMKRSAPLFADKFQTPWKTAVDKRLLAGAAIFGIGWGMSGFCPGPAISGLYRLQPESFIIVGSMLLGMLIFKLTDHKH